MFKSWVKTKYGWVYTIVNKNKVNLIYREIENIKEEETENVQLQEIHKVSKCRSKKSKNTKKEKD